MASHVLYTQHGFWSSGVLHRRRSYPQFPCMERYAANRLADIELNLRAQRGQDWGGQDKGVMTGDQDRGSGQEGEDRGVRIREWELEKMVRLTAGACIVLILGYHYKGGFLKGGGCFIIGQKQGSLCANFTQPYYGSVSQLNIWSRQLDSEEIRQVYTGCNLRHGDVFNWSRREIEPHIRGRVIVTSTTTACESNCEYHNKG